MTKRVRKDQWVWVVVQDPGGNEQLLGQYNEESDESFLPVFLEKEEAQQGLTLLTRDPTVEYEVQAIQYEDLVQRATENGFLLFILDGSGALLEKVAP
jgi:hypothetical protein